LIVVRDRDAEVGAEDVRAVLDVVRRRIELS